MLGIKTGVTPHNLLIAAACANAAQALEISVTITAGTDGKHMLGSKHYTGDALDVRSHGLEPRIKTHFLETVLARLGVGYQGFLEGAGTENEHFHFEYDPK